MARYRLLSPFFDGSAYHKAGVELEWDGELPPGNAVLIEEKIDIALIPGPEEEEEDDDKAGDLQSKPVVLRSPRPGK